jgi:zinc D-Ala-D-Ala dipeptidase
MEYLEYAIPILDWRSNAGGYKKVPVDMDDYRSNDILIEVEKIGIACESYYARTDGNNSPYHCQIDGCISTVWSRRLVAEKLLEANSLLRPYNSEVFVWDGYRSIETQKGLWSFFWKKSLDEMPTATDDRRRVDVLNYVSDPMSFNRTDPGTWPVHSTGGAVDLTLRNTETLELLDMGTSFDEMSKFSRSDFYERALKRGDINDQTPALRNRRLLHWAMESVGFVNYPLEFWHFDWGDQMFIYNLREKSIEAPKSAWYGYIDPPAPCACISE